MSIERVKTARIKKRKAEKTEYGEKKFTQNKDVQNA